MHDSFLNPGTADGLGGDACAPDVALEEDLDRGGEGDGEDGTEESAEEEAPEKDGGDDGHGMEADGLADDAGRDEEAVDLLDDGEDAGDDERHDPPGFGGDEEAAALNRGDDDGGDPAERDAEVGDDACDAEEETDEETEIEPHDGQSDAGGDAVDDADKELPPEEGDEVTVDLCEALHHFVFELGGPEGEVVRPLFFNVGALDEEVIEVKRDDDEGDQKSEHAQESTNARFDDVEGVSREGRKGVLDPLAGEEGLKVEFGENVGRVLRVRGFFFDRGRIFFGSRSGGRHSLRRIGAQRDGGLL